MPASTRPYEVWLAEERCELADLQAIIEAGRAPLELAFAEGTEKGIPLYERALLEERCKNGERRAVQAEIVQVLLDGPGVLVIRHGVADGELLDRVSEVYTSLVAAERAAAGQRGDHFAAPGANDRLWDALSKLALADPELFADYFGNEMIALVCEGWLGPGYQLTAQLNVVNPGGAAQRPHRDYHLGFSGPAAAVAYPSHVHRLSPMLTLQGAIAHGDTPLETGPTMFLPHSQKYHDGYVVAGLERFVEYVAANCVQVPLCKGDLVFFNPAVMHGAGHNATTDVKRMVNLLQVSSAFGRAMESVARDQLVRLLQPVLVARRAAGASERFCRDVVAATAEGYPFPLNLDRLPPLDALAPPSQQHLMWQAVCESWEAARLEAELEAHAATRRAWPPGPTGRRPAGRRLTGARRLNGTRAG